MGGAYVAIYVSLRNLLQRIGKDRVEADELRFKVVSEAFGGIKEVKLGGSSNLPYFGLMARPSGLHVPN